MESSIEVQFLLLGKWKSSDHHCSELLPSHCVVAGALHITQLISIGTLRPEYYP